MFSFSKQPSQPGVSGALDRCHFQLLLTFDKPRLLPIPTESTNLVGETFTYPTVKLSSCKVRAAISCCQIANYPSCLFCQAILRQSLQTHNRRRVTLLLDTPASLSDGQSGSVSHLRAPVTRGVFLVGGETSVTLRVGGSLLISQMDSTLIGVTGCADECTDTQTHTWSDFICASLLCTQPVIAESCGLIQIKIYKCSPKN